MPVRFRPSAPSLHENDKFAPVPIWEGTALSMREGRFDPGQGRQPLQGEMQVYSLERHPAESGLQISECSSAWPEHCFRVAGAAGSNPATPTKIDERR